MYITGTPIIVYGWLEPSDTKTLSRLHAQFAIDDGPCTDYKPPNQLHFPPSSTISHMACPWGREHVFMTMNMANNDLPLELESIMIGATEEGDLKFCNRMGHLRLGLHLWQQCPHCLL